MSDEARVSVDVTLTISVEVVGEFMEQSELLEILARNQGKLLREIEGAIRADTSYSDEIGWADDGNRQVYLGDLKNVSAGRLDQVWGPPPTYDRIELAT